MKNILLYICTCKKNLEKALEYQKIISEKNINYFFYHGEGESPNKNFICLNTSDCYSKLTQKTFLMLNNSLKYDYDFLLKIDDDTYVDFNELKNLDTHNIHYAGSTSSLNNHLANFSHYKNYLLKQSLHKDVEFEYKNLLKDDFDYVQGNFCILSRNSILKINDFIMNDKIYSKIPQEDISLGYICNKLKILPENLSLNFLPYYHATQYSIHPAPYLLLKLLYTCNSFEKKINACRKYIFMNKYFLSKEI